MVLSESRWLRLFSFFFLYFGQGLPIGLSTIAIPAWLAANGAPDADVALIAGTAYLPWSFKPIPAFLMDRYAYLPMGRRRLWLLVALAIMFVAFGIAAVFAPSVDDIGLLWWITFLLGAAAATQDVAVDGLAVDILPDREQGPASSFMFGGQTVGRSAAGAASGTLLYLYGSQVAFLAFLPVIALVALYAIVLRERPGEKRFPWSEGQAAPENIERHVGDWIKILAVSIKSLFKRDSLVLVSSAVCQRTAEGILLPLFPILAVSFLAYNEASYSQTISTLDFFMALTAIALGSLLTLKIGPKWAAMLIFTVQAGMCAFILFGREQWTIGSVFVGLLALQSVCSTLTSITTNPLRMQLSDPRVAASQFTIYNSISNLPVSFGAATVFVWLGGTDNLDLLMQVAIALLLVATAILWFIRIGAPPVKAEAVPRVD
jgi:MFS transporter, PAT family, beta-lactamase induction signal transducer AmpG